MAESRILIADDNAANCELLEAYLTDIDCEVQMAVDGQDTLDKVASFQPDVILLDIMMPKLNGFEVCKKIKDDARTRRIMVLMVTALNESGDIERAVAAGTDDFLSKPVQKIELVKRVQNMLRLKDVEDENERLRRYIEEMEESHGRGREIHVLSGTVGLGSYVHGVLSMVHHASGGQTVTVACVLLGWIVGIAGGRHGVLAAN